MQFKHTRVFNFEGAFRGMRNPKNSWDKSDSFFGMIDVNDFDPVADVADLWVENENKIRIKQGLKPFLPQDDDEFAYYDLLERYENWLIHVGTLYSNYNYSEIYDIAFLGPNDLALAQKLILAGDEHAKFMRQIFVSIDIMAPLYWWKEFDTYKIGTTANSTSTMHKLTSAPITKDCFELDKEPFLVVTAGTSPHGGEWELVLDDYIEDSVGMCEKLRQRYIETKDKRYWRALIQLLPESWLQTRTVTMSYANLRNMYFQRRNHKLTEWHEFCDWIKTLPWAHELITLEDKDDNKNFHEK